MNPLHIQDVPPVVEIETLQQSCSQSSFFSSSSSSKNASANSLSSSSSLIELRRGSAFHELRGRPYFNTMMGRRHIRPPVATSTSPRDSELIRQGSLYLQLRSKGVTDEVAFNRQRIFNRLDSIVNTFDDE